jgi:hypothetical protein
MDAELDPRTMLFLAAGALLLLTGFAAYAEHRRTKRRDLDRVGFMPWTLIQILAFLLAVTAAALGVMAA